MPRNKTIAIRSALHQIELSIEKRDQSKATERERDLLAVASCALWDANLRKVVCCLRRLVDRSVRSEKYSQVLELVRA